MIFSYFKGDGETNHSKMENFSQKFPNFSPKIATMKIVANPDKGKHPSLPSYCRYSPLQKKMLEIIFNHQ